MSRDKGVVCCFFARNAFSGHAVAERESSFIDNLLVRIHLIIVMISVDRPCAMGV